MGKDCLLYERKCTDCGECLVCDLDGKKKCDNCGKCIDEASEFRTINLDKIIIIAPEEEKN